MKYEQKKCIIFSLVTEKYDKNLENFFKKPKYWTNENRQKRE